MCQEAWSRRQTSAWELNKINLRYWIYTTTNLHSCLCFFCKSWTKRSVNGTTSDLVVSDLNCFSIQEVICIVDWWIAIYLSCWSVTKYDQTFQRISQFQQNGFHCPREMCLCAVLCIILRYNLLLPFDNLTFILYDIGHHSMECMKQLCFILSQISSKTNLLDESYTLFRTKMV